MAFENYASTLDILFNSNYQQAGPAALKRIMKNHLDREHDIVGGADYVIDKWRENRLRYEKDEPTAVKALEML